MAIIGATGAFCGCVANKGSIASARDGKECVGCGVNESDQVNLDVRTGLSLDFENLIAEVSPVAISAAAMVEDKWWLRGVGIFESGEHLSGLNTLVTLLALRWFRHYLLASRGA